MSQPIALFPVFALITGVLGFSVTNLGVFSGGSPTHTASVEAFWSQTRDALDADANEIMVDGRSAEADALCLIAKGADPIARLFSSLGKAPEFPDRPTAAALTALEASTDSLVAVRGGVVVSYQPRPDWDRSVSIGGATCAKSSTARLVLHHRPAAFSDAQKTVHLILSP